MPNSSTCNMYQMYQSVYNKKSFVAKNAFVLKFWKKAIIQQYVKSEQFLPGKKKTARNGCLTGLRNWAAIPVCGTKSFLTL